jgi:uncharacterized membrane protein
MQRLKTLIKFVFSNFGPIGVFYVANHFWDLRVAVISTVLWSLGEIVTYKLLRKPLSAFFLFSAGVTVLFGLIDIYLKQSILFKYEGAMTNVLNALYFGATLFGKKTLIQEFAEIQGRLKKEITPDIAAYFRFLTAVWVFYFLVKAGVYAWIAANYSLEQALVIRGTIGNASLYGMLFLSIFCSKKIKEGLTKVGYLPSAHINI